MGSALVMWLWPWPSRLLMVGPRHLAASALESDGQVTSTVRFSAVNSWSVEQASRPQRHLLQPRHDQANSSPSTACSSLGTTTQEHCHAEPGDYGTLNPNP